MRNRAGFTLLELMVVIAVIGILTGLSVLSINSLRQRHGFSGALQDVLLTLRQARIAAVEENETVMVSVNMADGTYRAFVDDGGGDATDGDLNGVPDKARNRVFDDDATAHERTVNSGTLPEGVQITAANFNGSTDFSFDNRGFPVDAGGLLTDGVITLASDLGGSKQIILLRSGHSMIQ